ncbi:unnamed protein product [Notodromas monacha]|uniref:Uncharacterized protein n=1 Tax=Notodromas monacha TaxID=399045 RepID=A0A7R9BTG3_9CRUS|nr:unnamed protein product [Notodromas monacha]CAG0921101.1 unnamed protein product [Notodromas monacha]
MHRISKTSVGKLTWREKLVPFHCFEEGTRCREISSRQAGSSRKRIFAVPIPQHNHETTPSMSSFEPVSRAVQVHQPGLYMKHQTMNDASEIKRCSDGKLTWREKLAPFQAFKKGTKCREIPSRRVESSRKRIYAVPVAQHHHATTRSMSSCDRVSRAVQVHQPGSAGERSSQPEEQIRGEISARDRSRSLSKQERVTGSEEISRLQERAKRLRKLDKLKMEENLRKHEENRQEAQMLKLIPTIAANRMRDAKIARIRRNAELQKIRFGSHRDPDKFESDSSV